MQGRNLVPVTLAAFVLAACGGAKTAEGPFGSREVSELIDWIGHPEEVSLLVMGGDATGEFEWQSGRSRPLGSTFKLLVLAAYAREVAAGRLDRGEPVRRAEVDQWYLEGTDGGAHERALAALPTDRRRLAVDQVVRAMIEFSDNAATDYLLARLGRERVLATAALLDLDELGAGVSPTAGALLALTDPGLGDSVDERIRRLRATPGERAAIAWRLAGGYAEAREAASTELAAALGGLRDWGKQVALADALPWRGSARDLAVLVGEAMDGNALGQRRPGSWPSTCPGHWPTRPWPRRRSASRRGRRRACGPSPASPGPAKGRGRARSGSSSSCSKPWTPPIDRRRRRLCLSLQPTSRTRPR